GERLPTALGFCSEGCDVSMPFARASVCGAAPLRASKGCAAAIVPPWLVPFKRQPNATRTPAKSTPHAVNLSPAPAQKLRRRPASRSDARDTQPPGARNTELEKNT